MKKIILLLILISTVSCNNNDDTDLSQANSLNGKWNWIKSEGSYNPTTTTPENTKQTRILEFSGNTLKTYLNGTLSATQNFSIETQKSIYGGDKKIIVIDHSNSIDNQYFVNRSFEIIGTTLILSDECADCYVSEYEKLK